jgi:hypothetical protein
MISAAISLLVGGPSRLSPATRISNVKILRIPFRVLLLGVVTG